VAFLGRPLTDPCVLSQSARPVRSSTVVRAERP
jgi:hypothetical protein